MPIDEKRSREFSDHLQQCQTQLMRYVFVLVRNVEDSQDVFQQTCMVLWEKFDEFDPSRSFLAWACGVARFKARDFLKQRCRHRARFSDEFAERMAEVQGESTSDEIEARQKALPGCVDKLPPSQQELLMLCYGENQRVADVAKKLGRPARGVHNTLRLVREKLFDCIDRAVRGGKQ